jgi:hypothetical protein
MATPFQVDSTLGTDLNNITTAADILANGTRASQRLGVTVQGTDGKLYVYAQANAAIPASTAVCTVNTTTFLVTATGGSYLSPATAMVSGDLGWFGKALV